VTDWLPVGAWKGTTPNREAARRPQPGRRLLPAPRRRAHEPIGGRRAGGLRRGPWACLRSADAAG
jgi:hypothetical protein